MEGLMKMMKAKEEASAKEGEEKKEGEKEEKKPNRILR